MKTLTVDDRHRVTLPEAEPGQVFAYEPGADGTIKLVPVVTEPAPKRVFAKLTKRGGKLIFELPEGYKLDHDAIAPSGGRRARKPGMKTYWDTSAAINTAFSSEVLDRLESGEHVARLHVLAEFFATMTGRAFSSPTHPEILTECCLPKRNALTG